MKEGIEKPEKQRNAEEDGVLVGIGICNCGNDARMEYTID
jgi:hypothetical protein